MVLSCEIGDERAATVRDVQDSPSPYVLDSLSKVLTQSWTGKSSTRQQQKQHPERHKNVSARSFTQSWVNKSNMRRSQKLNPKRHMHVWARSFTQGWTHKSNMRRIQKQSPKRRRASQVVRASVTEGRRYPTPHAVPTSELPASWKVQALRLWTERPGANNWNIWQQHGVTSFRENLSCMHSNVIHRSFFCLWQSRTSKIKRLA